MIWPPPYLKKGKEIAIYTLPPEGPLIRAGKPVAPRDYTSIVEELCSNKGIAFCETLPDDLVDDAIDAGDEVQWSDKTWSLESIYCERGCRGRCRFLLADSWQMGYEEIEELLPFLWDRCGVGPHATPGSLGQALMARHVYRAEEDKVWFPPARCTETMIRRWLVGGRVDTLRPGILYQQLIEEDVNNAYLYHSTSLPGGVGYAASARDYDPKLPGFWHCKVRIDDVLDLGPFPVRDKQKRRHDLIDGVHNVNYPTAPGSYNTTLWTVEVEDCFAAGLHVEILRGYQWPRWSPPLVEWGEYMHDLRYAMRPFGLEDVIKSVIVAGLGRFASRTETWQVTRKQRTETDRPLILNGDVMDCYITERSYRDAICMPHWYSCIISKQRSQLYQRALTVFDELVATNYDAIYREGVIGLSDTFLGGWKQTTLTNAMIVAARSLVSDQKTRVPGVPAETSTTIVV